MLQEYQYLITDQVDGYTYNYVVKTQDRKRFVFYLNIAVVLNIEEYLKSLSRCCSFSQVTIPILKSEP